MALARAPLDLGLPAVCINEAAAKALVKKNRNYQLIYTLLQTTDVDTLLLVLNMYKYIQQHFDLGPPECVIAFIHKCLTNRELRRASVAGYLTGQMPGFPPLGQRLADPGAACSRARTPPTAPE